MEGEKDDAGFIENFEQAWCHLLTAGISYVHNA